MRRLCIYVTVGKPAEQVRGRYVPYMLRHLKEVADRLVVVTDIQPGHANFSEIDQAADLIVRSNTPEIRLSLDGYRLGLAAIGADELKTYDEVLFVDTTCYGPIFPLQAILDDPKRSSADFWSLAYFTRQANQRIIHRIKLDHVMRLDFFSVTRRVLESPPFQKFLRAKPSDSLIENEHRLHFALQRAGFKWRSFVEPGQVETYDPMLFEAPKLVQLGCPVVSTTVFSTDPLVVDIQAIDCRAVLDALQAHTAFDTDMIWESVLPFHPLRFIQSNMDDLRIIESEPAQIEQKEWNFGGKIAVAAHIFYVEMLPEFCELVANVPCDFDFYISTSSEQHKQLIEDALKSFDCGGKKEVRVVEQNRGRDMSSLFITFRDVMLGDEYAWVLRLHSKRTPQMPWQVSQSFKRHLIENLVPSRRFVTGLFDLLEKPDSRNVGVVVPPVVHIGFGTLGHSWYANRKPLEKIAKELHIEVPLDNETPVAAYGTMYWFRPKALEPMFRHRWKWEDYNAEPNHIDGGLAHVQERLICYCAQQQGFRTLSVMSTGQAARSYLKLEYKHQILASCIPERDIRVQYRLAKAANWKKAKGYYTRFLDSLVRNDERFRLRAPKLWAKSRTAVNAVWPLLKGLEK